ncbi:ABC transporter ATP-binding protein [Candidatus Contubernalis alkaliaceticus]|uniref:ABC transporter ATP-binding protein n=1 Tax=Candidatus Contubernalis alkaliaceticus TaxID=338645 RepID=UPI001F4C4779|nr:energy-coupling factor ABC transporter ATP-binding protein [Candidatus Contubernalis alkalaceticus]UNC93094.1 energy-coupling factor ABC transporter ATP-binding protein [Candidatus Contubernalis alkalaceticus]
MIEINDVSFHYNDCEEESISNINLTVKKGEFLLLCGRSGCGKTTLTRLLNGLIPHFYEGTLKGEVLLEGRRVADLKMHQTARQVGSVFQDPRSQFFTVDTISEIAFTCENLGMPREEIKRRLENTAVLLKMEKLMDRSIFNLSSGEKQKIAVASVHAAAPCVYVLDEPSANLDPRAVEELREVLTLLKNKGHTIIIGEHRLYYLKDLVDRVIYMEGGKIKAELDRGSFLSLSHEERAQKGLRCLFPEKLASGAVDRKGRGEETALDIKNLCFAYEGNQPLLEGLCLKAGRNEVIGIIGDNGVGKSTFARILSGLIQEKRGTVELNSVRAKAGRRLKNSYFVMQDADYQLFTESVEDELKLGNEAVFDLEEKVEKTLKALGLDRFRERHPASLSGGQKQRVTIAVALVRDSQIVIFDEPTSGLDAENMKRVAAMLLKIAGEGKTVFVISHDYEFILHSCTWIVYLKEGKFIEDFPLNEKSLERLWDIFNGSPADQVL